MVWPVSQIMATRRITDKIDTFFPSNGGPCWFIGQSQDAGDGWGKEKSCDEDETFIISSIHGSIKMRHEYIWRVINYYWSAKEIEEKEVAMDAVVVVGVAINTMALYRWLFSMRMHWKHRTVEWLWKFDRSSSDQYTIYLYKYRNMNGNGTIFVDGCMKSNDEWPSRLIYFHE